MPITALLANSTYILRAYIYIIYSPNIGFESTVSGQERASTEGVGAVHGAVGA